MSGDIEIRRNHFIKKGRLRKALLETGGAQLDSLLSIARIDDPNVTRQSLESVRGQSPQKFFQKGDGSWAAFPDDEVRVIYSRPYTGNGKKRAKRKERGPLKAYEGPEPPVHGDFEIKDEALASVIIMGDELMMTGTPRLLIEYRQADDAFRFAIESALEEDSPVCFFSRSEAGTRFIGTRTIVDASSDRHGRLRVVASAAADDTSKFLAPSREQAELLLEAKKSSTLPVPVDGTVVVPFDTVPALKADEREILTTPSSPHATDSAALVREFRKIILAVKTDPASWSGVIPFLKARKALVDARTWEKLLLMAVNARNANVLDLIEVLDLYLAEEPDPVFSSTLVQTLCRCSDPEGKIVDVLVEYAKIARNANELKGPERLCIAQVFMRAEHYDEAAELYMLELAESEWLSWTEIHDATTAALFATHISHAMVAGFIEKLEPRFTGGGVDLPDCPHTDIVDCLFTFIELLSRHRPKDVVESIASIMEYLVDSQAVDKAQQLYKQYRGNLRKYEKRLELLSLFENSETLEYIEWSIEEIYDEYQRSPELIPALVLATAEQLEIAERIAGRESFYNLDVRKDHETQSKVPAAKPVSVAPLLARTGKTRIAIVGGSDPYRVRMKAELLRLGAVKTIDIPPSFEKSLDQAMLKEKLRNIDVVIQVTGYMKHAEHFMLRNLKHAPDLSFDIVPVNGGVSRGIMELTERLS